MKIWKNISRLYAKWKRYRYEKWAKSFAERNHLPYEGVLLLAGYKIKK